MPQEHVQGLNHLDDGGVRAIVNKLAVGRVGVRPIPGIGEGVELGVAGLAGGFAEKHVLIGVGIERRIQINEIHAGVGINLPVPQPIQVVAKEQTVHAQALYQNHPA
jgi:hypothetical protein